MKTKRSLIYLLILILVLSSMACALTDWFVEQEIVTEKDSGPDPIIEPTPTPTPIEVGAIEPEPANQGQIAYAQGGNLWLYYVDTAEIIQVTQDGVPDCSQSSYMDPNLSPDGNYLAYMRNDISYIQNLETNDVTSLEFNGWFLEWTNPNGKFFVYQGDLDCPEAGDLSEQQLLNFDLLRLDMASLGTPEFLGNVGGGLSYPQAISPDGQWTNVLRCGCYSECGGTDLINLPSTTIIPPPNELSGAIIDFSPDSMSMVVSQYQMYDYTQSPLYVGNIDYTNLAAIYSEPFTTPGYTLWSPTGEMLASTIFSFNPDTFVLTGSRVIIMHPDGTGQVVVDDNYAEMMGWSPDGLQLLYMNGETASKAISIYNPETGISTLLPFTPDHNYNGNIDWGTLPPN